MGESLQCTQDKCRGVRELALYKDKCRGVKELALYKDKCRGGRELALYSRQVQGWERAYCVQKAISKKRGCERACSVHVNNMFSGEKVYH